MENYHFRNWAQTNECRPSKFFEPENLDQLRSILSEARENEKKIRFVGYGHSPSDLCCTNDFLVSMKKFNRIFNIDQDRKIVSAESGVLLKDLVQRLKNENMALGVLPAIGELTLGGVVSTCTHGSGTNSPVLADFVISLSLLTADNELITCSRRENADIFFACCGGLGTFGVILSMELQCETYFNLKHFRYPMVFDQFLSCVSEFAEKSDHFKASYVPYTDRVIVSAIDRSTIDFKKSIPSIWKRSIDWFWNVFILMYVLEFLYFLAVFAPSLVQYVNRLIYRFVFADFDLTIDSCENIFFIDCCFHQYVSEWMIPKEKCSLAMKRLKNAIEENRIPAHIPVEIRFIRRDSFWLSPAYERDCCAINFIAYCPYERKPEYREYWKICGDIMKSLGGRPHLAKDHSMTRKDMIEAYPRFGDFLKLRQRLDKRNVFVNEYVERVFGKLE